MMEIDWSKDGLYYAVVLIGAYLVVWWVLRPLSFVYRIHHGKLSVRTFFGLPAGSIELAGLRSVVFERPLSDKPLLWLVSPYRRILGRLLFAETNIGWIALPDALWEDIGTHQRPEIPDAAGQLRGDARYQHVLAGLMGLNLGVRKLGSSCVLPGAASWCMILLPLWLTAVELVGSKLCAEDLHLPLTAVLSGTLPHFAASAFLILCGITTRGLLAFGMPLPLSLAGLSVFAAISRLSLDFPGSHDILSHRLFDSCTGYSDRHLLVSTACLVAAIGITLASVEARWGAKSIR